MVAELVARDGEPLPAVLAALRGTAHGVALPADAPALLVVPATTSCQAGACAVVLGPPLDDAGDPPP